MEREKELEEQIKRMDERIRTLNSLVASYERASDGYLVKFGSTKRNMHIAPLIEFREKTNKLGLASCIDYVFTVIRLGEKALAAKDREIYRLKRETTQLKDRCAKLEEMVSSAETNDQQETK